MSGQQSKAERQNRFATLSELKQSETEYEMSIETQAYKFENTNSHPKNMAKNINRNHTRRMIKERKNLHGTEAIEQVIEIKKEMTILKTSQTNAKLRVSQMIGKEHED